MRQGLRKEFRNFSVKQKSRIEAVSERGTKAKKGVRQEMRQEMKKEVVSGT